MRDSTLRLLIIGGYGFFGARLVRLLARDARLTLIIAGRSLHKAEACANACEGPAECIPAAIDRDGDLDAAINRHKPDYVIDASGPWQDYGNDAYRVAEAAISASAGYLDLADSSGFVAGIDSLNAAALEAGVPVISGLSTCPALSSAVVDRLKVDFESVDGIAGGIAPSPFAGMGLSVIEAIASYAGKPVHHFRHGAPATSYAFVDTRRFTISPPGSIPLPPLTFFTD